MPNFTGIAPETLQVFWAGKTVCPEKSDASTGRKRNVRRYPPTQKVSRHRESTHSGGSLSFKFVMPASIMVVQCRWGERSPDGAWGNTPILRPDSARLLSVGWKKWGRRRPPWPPGRSVSWIPLHFSMQAFGYTGKCSGIPKSTGPQGTEPPFSGPIRAKIAL